MCGQPIFYKLGPQLGHIPKCQKCRNMEFSREYYKRPEVKARMQRKARGLTR